MKNIALRCSLLLLAAALSACKSVDHSETAAEASSAAPEAAPNEGNAFVSKAAGFLLQKPSSWRFAPTPWSAANLDQLEYKSEDFAQRLRENATEPLVVVRKYDETIDPISPVFRATLRPLGQLRNMSAVEVAEMVIPQFRSSFESYELVGGVERSELSGHAAAHFVSSFTVGDSSGATREVAAETWIVKRGAYIFILGSSAPREDASVEEFRAIVQSIVIEARDY